MECYNIYGHYLLQVSLYFLPRRPGRANGERFTGVSPLGDGSDFCQVVRHLCEPRCPLEAL